jgi:hypothetical protein
MLDRLRPSRANLLTDLIAGVTSAFSYIPEGMAYALVAGRGPDLRTVYRCFCIRDWRIARLLQRTGLMRAIDEESVFAASANLGGSFKQLGGAAQEIVNKKKQIA